MNWDYLFHLFAIVQAGILIGLVGFIAYHYLPFKHGKKMGGRNVRWHVILVSMSYMTLVAATLRTATENKYDPPDIWFWLVTSAYLLGDVALIQIFKMAIRRERIEQFKQDIENELGKNIHNHKTDNHGTDNERQNP